MKDAVKTLFTWVGGIFKDETGNPSSKRVVGIIAGFTLCITMYHNSFTTTDIAPAEYKEKIKHKLEQHLEWLRPLDHLKRATVGFESAIKFMMSTDNTHLIDTFWRKTNELDAIRTENILDTIPELAALK